MFLYATSLSAAKFETNCPNPFSKNKKKSSFELFCPAELAPNDRSVYSALKGIVLTYEYYFYSMHSVALCPEGF